MAKIFLNIIVILDQVAKNNTHGTLEIGTVLGSFLR